MAAWGFGSSGPSRWKEATAARPGLLDGIRPAQLAPALAAADTAAPGSIKTLKLNLAIARADAVFDLGGAAVWYFKSTASTDVVGVRINDLSDVVDFSPGNAIGGYRFSRLKITNDALASGHEAVLLVFNTPDELQLFQNAAVRAV
jgi:hypothetical protein